MKYNKRQEKLLRRQAAWDAIPEQKMLNPTTKERNRSPMGTNIFHKPGSQKK